MGNRLQEEDYESVRRLNKKERQFVKKSSMRRRAVSGRRKAG